MKRRIDKNSAKDRFVLRHWDEIEKLMDESRFQQEIKELDKNQLNEVVNDRSKALEFAIRGIKKNEPEQLNQEYIENIADGIQLLAQKLLNIEN